MAHKVNDCVQEQGKQKANSRSILARFAFAILLLSLGGVAWYVNESVKEMRKEVAELRHLAVKPSAELEERITLGVEKFVQDAVGVATPKIICGIQNEARIKLHEICTNIETKLMGMQRDVANLDTNIGGISNALVRWQNEPIMNVQELIDAASSANDPELRRLYLQSALRIAKDKAPVMGRLVSDGMLEVERLRTSGDSGMAIATLDRLSDSLAVAKQSASVADMSKLLEMEKNITAKRTAVDTHEMDRGLAKQKYIEQIFRLSNYEEGQALKVELLTAQTLTEDDKDELDDMLMNRLACMTPVCQSIVIPIPSADFPYACWITNIMARFTNESISIEDRVSDYMKAEEVISQAETSSWITNGLVEIKAVGADLYSRCWVKQAKMAITGLSIPERRKGSLDTISDMISQVGAFTKGQLQRVKGVVVELHRAMFNVAMAEVDDNIENMKDLRERLGNDDMLQVVGIQYANCLQMLCKAQGLNRQYPGEFEKELTRLSEKTKALSKLLSGYRDLSVVDEKTKQKEQRSKFLKWARASVLHAEKEYKKAEGVAKEWLRTWKNPDAQQLLSCAWRELMVIDPNDLSVVDPALNRCRQELLEKIENYLRSDKKDLKQINYTRISDF